MFVSSQSVTSGTMLLSVPDEAVLMAEDSCIHLELEAANLGHGSFNERHLMGIRLVIALMAEKCAGANSRWDLYIASLPNEVPGMPLTWTFPQRAALLRCSVADRMTGAAVLPMAAQMSSTARHSAVHSTAGNSAVQQPEPPQDPLSSVSGDWPSAELPTLVAETWQTTVLPFVVANNHRFDASAATLGGERDQKKQLSASGTPPSADDIDRLHQLYIWATSVVAAYSFELGDDRFQALVPLWDSLNHVSGQRNVRLHHDEEKGELQMIATKSIAVGEELINDYGELGSAELLRRFGFVEPVATAHECAYVPWPLLLRAASITEGDMKDTAHSSSSKLAARMWKRLLQAEAAPEDGCFRIGAAGRCPPELALAAQIAIAVHRSRRSRAGQDSMAAAGTLVYEPNNNRKRKQPSGKGNGKEEQFSSADVVAVLLLLPMLSRNGQACEMMTAEGGRGKADTYLDDVSTCQGGDPASDAWRLAAARIVTTREEHCWQAYATWMARPNVLSDLQQLLRSRSPAKTTRRK